jgi:hypothetical protein
MMPGESLIFRFLNWLSSQRSPHKSPTKPSSARPSRSGRLSPGTAETNAAIEEAAGAYGFDADFMRAVASIESNMNPGIGTNRSGYTGLYQFGADAWQDYGQGGDMASARDSAMAAARMFRANARQLERYLGRRPTDTELYIAHQQGAGFYWPRWRGRNNMSGRNITGNPYPGMEGPQTRESFQAGWGAELERRMRYFEALNRGGSAQPPPVQGSSAQQPRRR